MGLDALFAAHPVAHAVVLAIAENAPFLVDVIRREPERLVRALTTDPRERIATLVAEAAAAVRATSDEAVAMRALRRMRSEAALVIALADIGGVLRSWP